MAAQEVLLRADVHQEVLAGLQAFLDLLGAQVEAAVGGGDIIILGDGVLYLGVHRVETAGAVAAGLGGGQAGGSGFLGDAVGVAAADVVGVFTGDVEQRGGLGSGLAAVAVDVNRLVIGDAVQLLSHGSAVGDVDSALDVAFGVVLSLAQVDDKTGGAVLDFG